jgi:carbamoyl-phosphate synthase large subunit
LEKDNIKSVLIIGSGPIIIGQACEFDYSCVQACYALRNAGYKTILLNSNPATIMTDPDVADVVYIESINIPVIEKILEKERPDAILSTMGGQIALNCAMELAKKGILEKYQIKLIGADRKVIERAESRNEFRAAMLSIGVDIPKSYIARNISEAEKYQKLLGFPIIIRPSYTLAGSGGGIAFNEKDFIKICKNGLALSPTNEILLEESLIGWKEFELEVIRDKKDNCIVVCSIENIDPMGIHTGDSITVAPAQTLTNKQYQRMRTTAFLVLREIGVQTGGANVQFAVDPKSGRQVVIEMNPRISRSSALASKATGFPIAKVAALLAVGFTLDELKNEITGIIPASFEPTLDYVVTKIPRFNFEKFSGQDCLLTTQMRSVGEVMAIGRTFQSSIQKALNSLDLGICGLSLPNKSHFTIRAIQKQLRKSSPLQILFIAEAFRRGFSIDKIHKLTFIDPWFLFHIFELVSIEGNIRETNINEITDSQLICWKQKGFSDLRIAQLLQIDENSIRARRKAANINPIYKRVDSCAAEFASLTPYLYSSYDYECEAAPSNNKKIVILGSGPNRIGQGIEFDYCCIKAVQALKKTGFEAIMINCNPETVSTDYDIADRLYFEPITLENVLDIVNLEKPLGLILQFGGQTPLKLAKYLSEEGVKVLGTNCEVIDLTEDREKFSGFISQLQIKQPANSFIHTRDEKQAIKNISFPLIVRPSYVLGGSSMKIVFDKRELKNAIAAISKSQPDKIILLDQYLENAIEVDVDCICDHENNFFIMGIMEHIEPAGIHSGDSSCVTPPITLDSAILKVVKNYTEKIIKNLKAVGLVNIQFAIMKEEVYVLEVNPRASRTVPFISKAHQQPYVEIATKCILGIPLSQQKISRNFIDKPYYCVKHAIIPFNKFPDAPMSLGPEMRATGEVMGIDINFLKAYKKSHESLNKLYGLSDINIFIECANSEIAIIHRSLKLIQKSKNPRFRIYAFNVLAGLLRKESIETSTIHSISDLALLLNENQLAVVSITGNSTFSKQLIEKLSTAIANSCVACAVSINTTKVILDALLEQGMFEIRSLNEWHSYLTFA